MIIKQQNRNEKTYDIKNNSNLKQINNLKNDIESIHSEISNQRIDNEELKINNDNLKGFLEKKLNEISKIRENIDNIKSENQFTIKSLEDVDSNVSFYH